MAESSEYVDEQIRRLDRTIQRFQAKLVASNSAVFDSKRSLRDSDNRINRVRLHEADLLDRPNLSPGK